MDTVEFIVALTIIFLAHAIPVGVALFFVGGVIIGFLGCVVLPIVEWLQENISL